MPAEIDPVIEWYIENHGFAQVLVVLKDQTATSPELAEKVALSVAKTENVIAKAFLDELPTLVGVDAAAIRKAVADAPGTDSSVAAVAIAKRRNATNRRKKHVPQPAPKMSYPLLGSSFHEKPHNM